MGLVLGTVTAAALTEDGKETFERLTTIDNARIAAEHRTALLEEQLAQARAELAKATPKPRRGAAAKEEVAVTPTSE